MPLIENNWIVEIPKTFMTMSYVINGANKLSKSLIEGLINKTNQEISILVITDATMNEFDAWALSFQGKRLIKTDYSKLHIALKNNNFVLGFVSGLDCSRLAYYRNISACKWPIISLVHSLGTRLTTDILEKIAPLLTPQDTFVCPSEPTKALLKKCLQKLGNKVPNSVVISHGVDQLKFTLTKHKKECRRELNLPSEKTILLHLSRFNPYTKMDVLPLIHLMSDLVITHPNVCLVLVGDSQNKEYIRNLESAISLYELEDSIYIILEPNQAGIEKYYQASDIFLSLSDNRAETFGLTVIEAMSCGLPVVISDIAGYKSLITDGVSGFYVPTYSAPLEEDLSYYCGSYTESGDEWLQSVAVDMMIAKKMITNLIDDKDISSRLSIQAKKEATSQFSKKEMVKKYSALFNKQQALKLAAPFIKLRGINALMHQQVTTQLKKSTVVGLTEHGKLVLIQKKPYVRFSKHTDDRPFLVLITSLILVEDCTIQSICDQLNLDQDVVYRHVLYLLKQYLITIK